MKTAIAYVALYIVGLNIVEPIVFLLLSIFLIWLTSLLAPEIAGVAFLVPAYLGGIISKIASCFVMVFLATHIFGWLSIQFSLWPIIIIFSLTTYNSLDRLDPAKGKNRPLEISYLIGETVGYTLGALHFVYAVSFKIVLSIAAIPVFVLLCCLQIPRKKSFPFWELAAEKPEEAYEWFQNDPCWVICDPPAGKNEEPDQTEYVGNFHLYVPSLERTITVWGKISLIEESEKRFIDR